MNTLLGNLLGNLENGLVTLQIVIDTLTLLIIFCDGNEHAV